jgi:pSer/pThr/pTyr-binding forkhead associated (FHA) protein
MSVRLTVTQRTEAGASAKPMEHVLDEAAITLGRDKGCQVVLAQQAVSRNHARISQEGNLYFLEDLGSAYGTQINGKPLPKGEKHRLRNGDIIAIAQFDVTFTHVADLPVDARSDKTSFVARSLVKDAVRGIKSGEAPYFRIMNGPREGERIEINDAQEIIIGRDDTADVVFRDDLISRRHVKFRRDWSGTHVEDLGSRNGIKVNKKKVNRKQLKDSDEIEVGNIRLLYVDPTDLPEPAVEMPDSGIDDDGGGGDEDEHTQSIPAGRVGSRRSKPVAKEEPPKEEPSSQASEPAANPEPPPPEPAPDPEPPPPPMPMQPRAAEEAYAGLGGLDKQKLVPLVLLSVFALLALGLIIAVLACA